MTYEEIEDEIEYWERQKSRHFFAIEEANENISELLKELREVDQ